jgi:nucleotide-binding universal stress UspA family protein
MAQWKRVVVGVDGSESSQAALRWASLEAQEHQAELVALLAWRPPPPEIAPPSIPPLGLDTYAQGQAEQILADTLAAVFGGEPPVPVTAQVAEGPAAKLLIEASRTADLVVVGTRGHGGFAGLLLGSVSQQVAAHAACSVTVVR